MIAGFGDTTTEDIFHGRASKAALKIAKQLWPRVLLKLDALNAAISLQDLKAPPSNHLEKLTGDLDGYWSIRVNDQYRIIFRFEDGFCSEVRCVDYH